MWLPDFSTPFDYIVVGGGTAGLTVASRLTEDQDTRVLVIEAGPDNTSDPLVLTPGLVGAQYGNEKYDWNFFSVPQVH
jgi:choline dehydrogenase-like flavoprotein